MKNKSVLTLALISLLTACGNNNPAPRSLDLKVLTPTGAPSIGMYMYAKNENFETTSNPKEGLLPMFKKGNYDVIFAPTQGGLNQIKTGAQYKIAATVTFGNFYILSSGRDSDGTLNAGDKILCFQETDIPGQVFRYVYGDLNLDVTYVGNVDATKVCIENNYSIKEDETTTVLYDYVFTAQPVVTTTKQSIFKNVQEDFKTKSGGLMMTQASIFVKNDSNKEKVDAFLTQIEKDIKDGIKNPSLIKKGIEELGEVAEQKDRFGVPGSVAATVTSANNGFSLGFIRVKDIKNDIQSFVNLLTNNNYGELPEEAIYQ